MSSDLSDRLDRFFQPEPARPNRPRQSLNFSSLGGREEETAAGLTLILERHYAWSDLSARASFGDVLAGGWRPALVDPRCARAVELHKMCFLDIETTGLSLGAGTVAFLVGIAHAEPTGLCLRQFVLRDFAEEGAQQMALARAMEQFDVVATYNGRRFDLPVLRVRSVINRVEAPWLDLPHLDLLGAVRGVWRESWPDCRLATAENRLLGVVRTADCEGWEVPLRYRQFLTEQSEEPLFDVLEHNAQDIISLAGLAAVLQDLFTPDRRDFGLTQAEWFGLARALLVRGRTEHALNALESGRALGHLAPGYGKAMRLLVRLRKRLGQWEDVRPVWLDLMAGTDPEDRFWAHLEEAKAAEHRLKDFKRALAATDGAQLALQALCSAPRFEERHRELQKRRQRLLKRQKAL